MSNINSAVGTERPKSAKVSLVTMIGYGLGELGAGLSMTLISTYFMFFCTEIYDIPIGIITTIFLVTRIWDAVDDPISGVIIDKTKTRFGTYRPYILAMPILLALSTYSMFTTPSFGLNGKTVWILVVYGLNSLIYSFTYIPYNILPSTMTTDPNERTALATWRNVFACTATVVINSTMAYAIARFGQSAIGYQYTAIIFGIASVLMFLVVFKVSKETHSYKNEETSYKIKEIIPVVIKNKPYLALISAYILTVSGMGVFYGSMIYYFQLVVGNMGLLAKVTSIALIPSILMVLFGYELIKRFDKKKVFIVASLVNAFAYVLPLILGPKDTVLYASSLLVAMATPSLTIIFSCLPDTVDYGTYITGRECGGMLTSFFTFFNKASFALGGALCGYTLSLFHYMEGGVKQTAGALNGISICYTAIPALFLVLSAVAFSFYNLTSKDVQRINSEMSAH